MNKRQFFLSMIMGFILWIPWMQAYRPYRRCSRHAAKRWRPYATQYAEKMFKAVTSHAPLAEIRRLAEAYPDVLQTHDANGRTPLHWAAVDGMVLVAELFLSLGANVDVQDVRGNTPIHLAVANTSNLINRLNTITVLMDAGASPILRNEHGLNTFDLAKSFTVQDHLYDLSRRRVELVRRGQKAGRRIGRLLRENQEEVERYLGQSESVSAEAVRIRQEQSAGQPVYGGFIRASELENPYLDDQLQSATEARIRGYQPGDEFISVFEGIEAKRVWASQKPLAAQEESALTDKV